MRGIHAFPGAPQNVLILALLITKEAARWLHGSLKATVPVVLAWPKFTPSFEHGLWATFVSFSVSFNTTHLVSMFSKGSGSFF